MAGQSRRELTVLRRGRHGLLRKVEDGWMTRLEVDARASLGLICDSLCPAERRGGFSWLLVMICLCQRLSRGNVEEQES